jgi:hypothetical protein
MDDAHTRYEFVSEGAAGAIKKVVLYEYISDNFFNLGFGDWNEALGRIDDSIRSNNGDRDKVLATVAATAVEFTNQMGIAYNLEEIQEDFEIEGLTKDRWEPFQRGRNYNAFSVRRR